MLSLSTDAAPELSLEALDAACRARGLDGQELVIAPDDDAMSVIARARSSHARVVALRIARLDDTNASAVARCSGTLGVPVSVPPKTVEPDQLPRIATAFARAGGRLLLGHRMNLDDALAAVSAVRATGTPASLGLAWEIHPSSDDLGEASAILFATHELLGAVRLHGGGPEQRDQDGRGVGPLFVELSLSGFTGPIILAPSAPELVARWTTWLGSRGSSGCGHAVSARTIELDVREVEPRNRLETILGAYRTLVPGATLHLTVDHDPVCMYYTLEATEPEHSFAFQIVEHGPEVWRAEVTKR
jgi:uncharacterized protein (DUF2249 family)